MPVRAPQRRSRLEAAHHSVWFSWIDPHVTHRPGVYVRQSMLAAGALALVLLAQDILTQGALVAAIASSVAIVFFVPHSIASSPKRIVGGHVAGVVAAYVILGASMLFPGSVADERWFIDLGGALALGLVIFIMTATNTEHAPAAGTALGLAVRGPSANAVIFIITAAVIVALVRVVLARHLHNLV